MKRAKQQSKLVRLAGDTATYHAHASTADVQRRHIVLSCEANVLDQEIVSLRARIAGARAQRANVEAQLVGLAMVVGKR